GEWGQAASPAPRDGTPAAASACPGAPTSTATAPGGQLEFARDRFPALLIEHVEGRQADVGHLLLTERDFVAWQVGVRRLIHDRCRRSGCAAGERQRNSGGTHRRQRDLPPLSLGALLPFRHDSAFYSPRLVL